LKKGKKKLFRDLRFLHVSPTNLANSLGGKKNYLYEPLAVCLRSVETLRFMSIHHWKIALLMA